MGSGSSSSWMPLLFCLRCRRVDPPLRLCGLASGVVRSCCLLATFGPGLATSPLLGTLLILLAGASVQTQPFADIDVSVHVPVVLRLSSIKRPMLGNALRSWGTPKVLVEAGGRPVSPNWGVGGAYLVCNEGPKLHTKPSWFLYAVSGLPQLLVCHA